jgi:CBS domain-containing protein
MLKAADIMKTDVVTVTPGMSVEELGRLFMDKDISGAPVIDAEGRLFGIVTENDLIRRNRRFHIPTMLRIFDAFIPMEGSKSIEREIREMSAAMVKDICSKEVITINEDTPLEEIATLMSEKKVHLLPVMREDELVGIVGKQEVIKGIAG